MERSYMNMFNPSPDSLFGDHNELRGFRWYVRERTFETHMQTGMCVIETRVGYPTDTAPVGKKEFSCKGCHKMFIGFELFGEIIERCFYCEEE